MDADDGNSDYKAILVQLSWDLTELGKNETRLSSIESQPKKVIVVVVGVVVCVVIFVSHRNLTLNFSQNQS